MGSTSDYDKKKADLVQIRLRDTIHFKWRRRGVVHRRIWFQILNELLIPNQREICSLAVYRIPSCRQLTITVEVTSSQPRCSACTTYMEQDSSHIWKISVAMDTKHNDILQMAQFWSVDRKGPLYITYIVSMGHECRSLDRPGCTA